MTVSWADAIGGLNKAVEAEFGEPIAEYTRPGTTPTALPTIRAIFETKANADHVAAGDVPVDGTEPRLDVRHATLGVLQQPRRGDTFTARGQRYIIERVIPGTIGHSVCHCTEVDA
jgi:hypothetical protein